MILPPGDSEWEVIIRAAQAGDERAWRSIFRQCDPKIRAAVRRALPSKLRQRENEEDVAQSARLRLFISLKKMNRRTLPTLESWAVQAATWAAREFDTYWNRQMRNPVNDVPLESAPEIPARDSFLLLLSRLPREYRDVVKAIGEWQLSIVETAEALELSEREVERRLRLALLLLGLDERGDET